MVKNYRTLKEIENNANFVSTHKIKCKCSHPTIVPPNVDRVICSWCGHWVYKDEETEEQYKKKEFERKLKKYLKETEEKARIL